MKILVDAHVFDGKYQGTRTYIKGLYNELILKNKSWTFYFISNDKNNLSNQFINSDNVNFLEYKYSNRAFQLIFEFPLLNRKLNIDYSHFQYISPLFKFGKHIVTNHDILFEETRFKHFFPFLYRYIKGPLFRLSAKRADVLLTVSEYSKGKLNEIYNIPINRIGVTHNAIEFNTLNTKEKTGKNIKEIIKSNYLLYVSRIEPRKNHISILRAYKNLKLKENFFKIIFVGSQDITSSKLNKYIQDNEEYLKNDFFIFNKVNDSELYELYKHADLVLYPSIAEGFGIPPLEAGVLKKKVVCSNLTAMSSFNFFPYHVNPLNQIEFEKAITEALNDNNYPYNYINKTILERYSWEKSAIEFKKMLN
ncbi:glycosyltransferase family 1 protein [Seonamhaeicola sp. ML3]|uniref:glycosyltransferase family 4 protein n=1 Tax=Seonamhaeicola sp. ML3 TaxID=2937786 RepID=UPI00200DB1DE|nr:glycosyltransferase family 1 protein [Seonamhaeicola sp. ML3]